MFAPSATKILSLFAAILVVPLSLPAQSQKEITATLNRVSDQLIRGNVDALDNVKALPPDHDIGALLMFFKDHYYLNKPTDAQKAIAAKAAQYITECPTASDYIKRLYKKEAGRPKSGLLLRVREAMQQALIVANNKFSIRVMMELMDEADLEFPVESFAISLAVLDIPGAPFSKANKKGFFW